MTERDRVNSQRRTGAYRVLTRKDQPRPLDGGEGSVTLSQDDALSIHDKPDIHACPSVTILDELLTGMVTGVPKRAVVTHADGDGPFQTLPPDLHNHLRPFFADITEEVVRAIRTEIPTGSR